MKEESPAYLSISDFAKKLNVHHNTIRRAIKKGRIRAFRVSDEKKAAFRIPVSEIDRLALFDMKEMIDNLVEAKLKEMERK